MEIIIFCSILGACIGSFINVVVRRMREGEGGIVSGSSHCPECAHDLAWYDNIPIVSYLCLSGKCRYCAEKISSQYIIVESLMSAIFALVTYSFLVWRDVHSVLDGCMLAGLLLGTAAMVAIGVYDFLYMEVPMTVLWWGVFFAILYMTTYAIGERDGLIMVRHIVAGVCAFLFFFSLSYFSGEKWMGAGDGYIALAMGLLLGGVGVFVAILLAVWSGTIVGICMLALQKAERRTQIPFGPFLVGGMIGSFVVHSLYPQLVVNMFGIMI